MRLVIAHLANVLTLVQLEVQSFLQIVFHQTVDTYNSGTGNTLWWEILTDVILPIGIAGLAAYMVYFIFIKETKRDRAIDERKKEEERSDKLIFFSALVESALRTSVHQKNNIKEQIRAINISSVEVPAMAQVPLNDLKRITEVLNLEDYLLSYTNFYNLDRTSSVKEFKNIIASIDFLYASFNQIINQLQKSQMYDYERKTRLAAVFASGYNLVGKMMISFQESDPVSFATFLQIYQRFIQGYNGINYDLTFYYNFFFIPYNDFCTTYVTNGGRATQGLLDLAGYTRDGKQLFEQIKSENDIIRYTLIRDFKSIYATLINLRGDSKKLLRDF